MRPNLGTASLRMPEVAPIENQDLERWDFRCPALEQAGILNLAPPRRGDAYSSSQAANRSGG